MLPRLKWRTTGKSGISHNHFQTTAMQTGFSFCASALGNAKVHVREVPVDALLLVDE